MMQTLKTLGRGAISILAILATPIFLLMGMLGRWNLPGNPRYENDGKSKK